jgi:hypothetical protein
VAAVRVRGPCGLEAGGWRLLERSVLLVGETWWMDDRDVLRSCEIRWLPLVKLIELAGQVRCEHLCLGDSYDTGESGKVERQDVMHISYC